MKKVTIADIEAFDTERFNEHYRNLIDIGLTSSREEDAISTLSFINDFQILIEDLKKDYAAEPDGCQQCNTKDQKIQRLKEDIKYLKQLKNLQNDKIEELEKQLAQSGNQQQPQKMKVCK